MQTWIAMEPFPPNTYPHEFDLQRKDITIPATASDLKYQMLPVVYQDCKQSAEIIPITAPTIWLDDDLSMVRSRCALKAYDQYKLNYDDHQDNSAISCTL